MKKDSLDNDPLFSAKYYFSSHQGLVLNGLNELRLKEELVDVTLIVEGQPFKAHKVVLSACSDYFRAMFTDNMIEARRNEIHLKGLNAKGFLLVLEYAYTGQITLNLSNVQEVLEAASYVQILTLINSCCIYLEEAMDNDNCLDIATIAETYSLTALKTKAYKYMNQNLSSFSQTSEFYRITPLQLETLLAYDFPVDCSEQEVYETVIQWCFWKAFTGPELNAEEALRILQQVHFCDIPPTTINTILGELNDNQERDCVLHSIVVNEICSQLSTKKNYVPTNLLNPRGMELAVLKIGGFGTSGMTNEITYKLSSESKWRQLTKIPHLEQCNYGTVVLNNELYIVGGCFNQNMQENIHPFGFKYNIMHNKWSPLSRMNNERCRFSLNLLNGKMYAVGGVTGDEEFDHSVTDSCECYDPATDQWSMMAFSPVGITRHSGAAHEPTSKLFISGGFENDSTVCQNSMYCYDEKNDSWSECAPMLTPRADHEMLSINGSIYVCGGWDEDEDTGHRTFVNTIDVYDVESDCWTVLTTVPSPRHHASVINIGRKIYFIGGFSSFTMMDKNVATIDCYDLDSNVWTSEGRYPYSIWEHTCSLLYVPKCTNGMEVMANPMD